MAITIHKNKNLLQFVIMHMDGIPRANTSHSHNGQYVSEIIGHIPQRALQAFLSCMLFDSTLPKQHGEEGLPGGCPATA